MSASRVSMSSFVAITGNGVRLATVTLPFPIEFVLEDFGTAFSRQACLVQTEFAHLHIVDTLNNRSNATNNINFVFARQTDRGGAIMYAYVRTGDQKNRRFVGMKFHLSGDVLTIEMSVPPSAFTSGARGPLIRLCRPRRTYKRNPKESLRRFRDNELLLFARRTGCFCC